MNYTSSFSYIICCSAIFARNQLEFVRKLYIFTYTRTRDTVPIFPSCKLLEDHALHWKDTDFLTCKLDLRNAFNMVSHQAILEECALFFVVINWFSGDMVNTHISGTSQAF